MRTVRIIGVGAPQGDDWLGWELAERLRASERVASWGERVSVVLHDNPAMALSQAWQGDGLVVLCDAVRSGAEPGTVHRLDATQLQAQTSATSGGGFGVAQAVRLAAALESLPESLLFYGIEASPAHMALCLSEAVYAALPGVVAEIEALIAAHLQESGSSDSPS